MGREWQIGDPVDYSNDGWMDAQNWSCEHYVVCNKPADKSLKRDEYLKKAWKYYKNHNARDALQNVDLALDLDRNHARSWNIKAIILGSIKKFPESDRCFERSLQLNQTDLVQDNRARMLYDWASELLHEYKDSLNPHTILEAEKKITTAINMLPGENSKENIDKYLNLKDSIQHFLNKR